MAAGDLKLGKDKKIYVNELGAAVGNADNTSRTTGTDWVFVENMLDNIEHDPQKQTGKLHERGRGFIANLLGDPDHMLKFKISVRPGLDCYDVLKASHDTPISIGVMIADGSRATVGTRGIAFDGLVTEWKESDPLSADPGTVDVTIGVSGMSTFDPYTPTEFVIS